MSPGLRRAKTECIYWHHDAMCKAYIILIIHVSNLQVTESWPCHANHSCHVMCKSIIIISHSFTHTVTHSLIHSFIQSFNHSFNRSFHFIHFSRAKRQQVKQQLEIEVRALIATMPDIAKYKMDPRLAT